MMRRLLIVPTIIVLAAVAIMIALGVWQLRRAHEKDSLIAKYQHAANLPPITWPTEPLRAEQLPLVRHATGMCVRPVRQRAVAGENRTGDPGYAHIVECATGAKGSTMSVEVGWSKNPNAKVNWNGGPVSGIMAPDRRSGMRLTAPQRRGQS